MKASLDLQTPAPGPAAGIGRDTTWSRRLSNTKRFPSGSASVAGFVDIFGFHV
jgi:hypothetical protein